MKTEPLLLLKVLLLSFGLGATLGAGNDLLHFLASVFSHVRKTPPKAKPTIQTVAQALQDVLFCLVAGFVITVILFYYNDGRLRGFSLIAMLMGYLAYRYSLGKLSGRFSARLSAVIGKGIYLAFFYVTRPVIRVSLWSFRVATKPIRLCQIKISERRIRKYDTARMEQLRKISKKGFVNI